MSVLLALSVVVGAVDVVKVPSEVDVADVVPAEKQSNSCSFVRRGLSFFEPVKNVPADCFFFGGSMPLVVTHVKY